MTDRNIENKVNTALNHITPDVLDAVLERCKNCPPESVESLGSGQSQLSVVPKKASFIKSSSVRKIAGIAAAFVVIFGILFSLNARNTAVTAETVVTLDVNPGFEMELSGDRRVLNFTPVNDDAKAISGSVDIVGKYIDESVEILVNLLVSDGYITADSNSVLLTVENEDSEKSSDLKQMLASKISSVLKCSKIDGAIISQLLKSDENVKSFAEKNNLSVGKAALVISIVADQSNNYTADSLSELSVNDLNLLAGSQLKRCKNIEISGKPGGALIGGAKAGKIALSDKLVEDSGEKPDVKYGCKNGKITYDVDFADDKYKYNYKIDAKNGDIIGFSKISVATDTEKFISEQSAKTAAFNYAGVSGSKSGTLRIGLIDAKTPYYSVSFNSSGYSYDISVNAVNGTVISCKKSAAEAKAEPEKKDQNNSAQPAGEGKSKENAGNKSASANGGNVGQQGKKAAENQNENTSVSPVAVLDTPAVDDRPAQGNKNGKHNGGGRTAEGKDSDSSSSAGKASQSSVPQISQSSPAKEAETSGERHGNRGKNKNQGVENLPAVTQPDESEPESSVTSEPAEPTADTVSTVYPDESSTRNESQNRGRTENGEDGGNCGRNENGRHGQNRKNGLRVDNEDTLLTNMQSGISQQVEML